MTLQDYKFLAPVGPYRGFKSISKMNSRARSCVNLRTAVLMASCAIQIEDCSASFVLRVNTPDPWRSSINISQVSSKATVTSNMQVALSNVQCLLSLCDIARRCGFYQRGTKQTAFMFGWQRPWFGWPRARPCYCLITLALCIGCLHYRWHERLRKKLWEYHIVLSASFHAAWNVVWLPEPTQAWQHLNLD